MVRTLDLWFWLLSPQSVEIELIIKEQGFFGGSKFQEGLVKTFRLKNGIQEELRKFSLY